MSRTGSISKTLNALGKLINPATEDKQNDTITAINNISGISSYNYIVSEETVTLKYYGYTSITGWQIKRKTLSTGVWEIADALFTGTYADFDTAWAARAAITYSYT